MKVKVIEENRKKMGSFSTVDLLKDKIYNAVIDSGKMKWYRIVDESGEDYMYPPMLFEIIEDEEKWLYYSDFYANAPPRANKSEHSEMFAFLF